MICDPFLYIGITLATLNLSGTTPVDIEQLNIHSKGFEMTVANNFKLLNRDDGSYLPQEYLHLVGK